MKINLRGSNLEVTDSIDNYINSKLGKLEKYFEKPNDVLVNVLIKTRKNKDIIEVTIYSNIPIIRIEEEGNDLYSLVDKILNKLERNIKKYNKKNKDRKANKKIYIENDIENKTGEKKSIIKRKEFEMKPMNEKEALLQMDMLNHDFYVFKDIKDDVISVIYKRKDKNYGIIKTK